MLCSVPSEVVYEPALVQVQQVLPAVGNAVVPHVVGHVTCVAPLSWNREAIVLPPFIDQPSGGLTPVGVVAVSEGDSLTGVEHFAAPIAEARAASSAAQVIVAAVEAPAVLVVVLVSARIAVLRRRELTMVSVQVRPSAAHSSCRLESALVSVTTTGGTS